MKSFKRSLLALTVVAAMTVPASPALAQHNCEADDPTLEGLCEYHPSGDYKQLIRDIRCLVTNDPTC